MTRTQALKQSFSRKIENLRRYVSRVLREFSPEGLKLPQHSATTFLDRMVKANRTHSLSLGKAVQEAHLNRLCESQGIGDLTDLFQKEDFIERNRALANTLGLAVVTSVNYAQGTIPQYSSAQ
jgi:hypothetical protein